MRSCAASHHASVISALLQLDQQNNSNMAPYDFLTQSVQVCLYYCELLK